MSGLVSVCGRGVGLRGRASRPSAPTAEVKQLHCLDCPEDFRGNSMASDLPKFSYSMRAICILGF